MSANPHAPDTSTTSIWWQPSLRVEEGRLAWSLLRLFDPPSVQADIWLQPSAWFWLCTAQVILGISLQDHQTTFPTTWSWKSLSWSMSDHVDHHLFKLIIDSRCAEQQDPDDRNVLQGSSFHASMGHSHDREKKCVFPRPVSEQSIQRSWAMSGSLFLRYNVTEPCSKQPCSPWWRFLVAPVALVNLVVLLPQEPLAALSVPARAKTGGWTQALSQLLHSSASPWEPEGSTTPWVWYSLGGQADHFGQESPPLLPGHSLVHPAHKGKKTHAYLHWEVQVQSVIFII